MNRKNYSKAFLTVVCVFVVAAYCFVGKPNISADPLNDSQSFENAAGQEFVYPTNDSGQTYGTFAEAGGLNGDLPDLILVVATNGETGYITKESFIITSRAASNPAEADIIMGEYRQNSARAFCDYVYQESGIEIDSNELLGLLEIGVDIGLGNPWTSLAEHQKITVVNLLPEGYQSTDFAQKAWDFAARANSITIPVYANDGITIIGEFIVG
jgi:hypothetical protein